MSRFEVEQQGEQAAGKGPANDTLDSLKDEGLDTFCRLPADRDAYPRPEGLEVFLHTMCHYDALSESEAKRAGEQWRECARRYPHAALALHADGDKRIAADEAFARYVRWWAHHARMDDPATAWRILGPGSPSWQRADFDLLALIMLGVFGDELELAGVTNPEEILRRLANLAGASDQFRLSWVTSRADEPRSLFRHLLPDWDERWKSDRYLVTYRVGQVEETLWFTPDEVDAAIHAVNEKIRAATRAEERVTDTAWRVIDDVARFGQNFTEYMVRHRYGCGHVLDPNLWPREIRRAIKRLAKSGCVPCDEWQREVWSTMIIGFVMWFRGVPAHHDHLVVTDRAQTEIGSALEAGRAILNPAITEERLAELKAMGWGTLGGRTFSSRRTSVN
jgi:hypothetical protein